MADKQNRSRTAPQSPSRQPGTPVANTVQIIDIINELNITRKNVLIYPDEHVQIQNSIKRSFDALNQIFADSPKLAFTISDTTMIAGNESFGNQNKRVKEFADAIRRHEIVSMVFFSELEPGELLRFLRIIAIKPETVRNQGGIEKAMMESSILNIEIRTIDFSQLHLTEEENIVIGQAGGKADTGTTSTWHNLVMGLTSDALLDADAGADLFLTGDISSAELAGFLNEHKLDSIRSVRMFEKIYQMSLANIEPDAENSEQDDQCFDNVNRLLQELNPELRKQFLAVTFQHCNEGDDQQARKILRGLQENFAVEMMRQANVQKQKISPSLLDFSRKIGNIKDLQPTPEKVTPSGKNSVMKQEEAETLFKRENYEQYVSTEYQEMLSTLASTEQAAMESTEEVFALEEHLETLEEKNLDIQIARVLIAFINENIELDEYLDYSQRLITICREISITRDEDFNLLKEIFFTFKLHAIHKSNPKLRSAANDCLKEIESPLFVATAIDAFDKLGKQENTDAIEFLVLLGPKIVPEAVNLYAKYETPNKGTHLIDLLSHFNKEACNEIKKRIHDPRPAYVRNLVILTREIGNREITPYLDHLLDHPDETIKLETLSALLKFHHAKAGTLLCELLDSNRPEVVYQAIQLSGRYKVQETAEHLVKMIKTPAFTKTTIQKNEKLVIALSDIGNPVAIPFLEKLAKTSFTLFPKALLNMKQTIFQTLNRYPEGKVSVLLQIGSRIDNKAINDICQQYRRNVQDKNQN